MITIEDLERWDSVSDLSQVNQQVINAAELIVEKKSKLHRSVKFDRFARSVRQLADKMPSTIAIGWKEEIRSMLYTASLGVFKPETMSGYVSDFERLFELSVDDLQEQRDTGRWNVYALPKICAALTKNIDLMSVETYRKFLECSISFTLKQREAGPEKAERHVFFFADAGLENHSHIFSNHGIVSLLKQGVGKGIYSDVLGSPGRIDSALNTAKAFTALDDVGVRMKAWQLDMLLVTQVVERLTQAHGSTDDKALRDQLSRGVLAIAGVFCRPISEKPTMRGNCFRSYLFPTDWSVWMDPEPMAVITKQMSIAIGSTKSNGCAVIEEAVKRLKMQLLIDATLCAQSLAPKNGKQTKFRDQSAISVAKFIRFLVPACEEPMSRPGALKGLNIQAKAVLIGLLPHGDSRKTLLKSNKRAKGQVLMDDLGM